MVSVLGRVGLALAVACTLASMAFAPPPCVTFDSIASRLGYCDGYVTWDVTETVNASLTARARAAQLQYDELAYQYTNNSDSVPVNCLAFQPLYACAVNIPKCYRGVDQALCEQVCEERNWRCDTSSSQVSLLNCGNLPDEDCSRGARDAAASIAVAVVALGAAGWASSVVGFHG